MQELLAVLFLLYEIPRNKEYTTCRKRIQQSGLHGPKIFTRPRTSYLPEYYKNILEIFYIATTTKEFQPIINFADNKVKK